MPDLFHNPFKSQPTEVKLTREEADFESLFTDSEEPRRIFDQMVMAQQPAKQLIVVHGLGGGGKSSLLKMYRLSCRRKRIAVALAGAEDAPSVAALLGDWAEDLAGDKVQLPTFQTTLNHYRSLRSRVEAEARKSGQGANQIGEKMGKSTVKTAAEMAAGTIPGIGPFVAPIAGAGAEAFMDWLRGVLPKSELDLYLDPTKQLTDEFLNDLTKAATKQRLVLMADTYEQMTTLDDWMCDFAHRLPENVLLVIAGRAVPEWEREWNGWMGRAELIELKEMTPDNLRDLVHRYYGYIRGGQPDSKQVAAIVEFAHGLPMVATTVVQLWVKYGVEDFTSVKHRVVADLVDRLLEGVPKEMRPAFEAASVLRYFNADSLRALLEGGDADELYAELRCWPFVRARREGLAVHETMREMINEALKARAPERFCALHERAAAYYEAKMGKAGEEERERLTLEQLYHLVQADEEKGIKVFQKMAEELARYRMVNRLRLLLNNANNWILELENSKAWRDYYNARVMSFERRHDAAEQVYRTIGDNNRVEPKLKAYALCDLADILVRDERISQPYGADLAQAFIQESLKYPLDDKLVMNYIHLGGMFASLYDYDQAIASYEKATRFFEANNNPEGTALTVSRTIGIYAVQGDWRRMFDARKAGLGVLILVPGKSAARAAIIGIWAVAWVWAGRPSESERNNIEAKSIEHELGLSQFTNRDLGFAVGMQNRFNEIEQHFQGIEEEFRRYKKRSPGLTLSFWGSVLIRQGNIKQAEELLKESIASQLSINTPNEITHALVSLAQLQEIKADNTVNTGAALLLRAEQYYVECLEHRRTGRHYFECGALTGLVRVKHAQKQYDAIPALFDEAEQLAAQKYEFNDHLASLRLTQGHVAWDGHIAEWGEGFDAALNYYKYALIHALRYNRFMLDEVLWGGGISTPLHPIIPFCLERGEEGRRMLVALRNWWQTDKNDIGTPRPDTISPIPEGISLLEGEQLARQREPGDGSPQVNVVDKINAALV